VLALALVLQQTFDTATDVMPVMQSMAARQQVPPVPCTRKPWHICATASRTQADQAGRSQGRGRRNP